MFEISHIELCGFRGYTEPTRIDFSSGFNIISGRNGVGKSTLCDAVEYVLTGSLYKYQDAKSSGESVDDYIWWRGASVPSESFVEVGFLDEVGKVYSIRRNKGGSEPTVLKELEDSLCDKHTSPPLPLVQLTKTSIIRDEFISTLSLDLKETERFQLLRDALGTPDSDSEIAHANDLWTLCKKKTEKINELRERARATYKESTAKIEQIRARISEDSAIKEATNALQVLLGTNSSADNLVPIGREALSQKRKTIDTLEVLRTELISQVGNRERFKELSSKQDWVNRELREHKELLDKASQIYSDFIKMQEVSKPEENVRLMSELIELGQQLGLVGDHCPLCDSTHTEGSFQKGIHEARSKLHELNENAEIIAKQKIEQEADIRDSRSKIEKYESELIDIKQELSKLEKSLNTLSDLLDEFSYEDELTEDEVVQRISEESSSLLDIENALRVLDTLSFNSLLEASIRDRKSAEADVKELEMDLAKARRAESRAKSLHNAARRAVNEALDDRLDLIGPLLADLYRRLRPHTSWRDIDYKIRGDVKRFLRLEVGEGLNPQFIFSSGQRRATGIAFLLSVYLSTSWSKLRTVMLDDPVQHIDDFRAVHLAEVLASLHTAGHQVICAVEDPALAALLCRRLPNSYNSEGLHYILGENERGVLGVIKKEVVTSSSNQILQQGTA